MTMTHTLTTRDIGEAENALRANLMKVISTADLEYGHWVAIQMIVNGKASISAIELSKPLKISVNEAQVLLDSLQARGIIRADFDRYCMDETSAATVDRLRDEIKSITTEIFHDLDQDDLIAAHRVLAAIAGRANNLLHAS